MQLKLLIFDLDGTLANTIPLCVGAIQHALTRNTGRVYSHEEIVAQFGVTERGVLQKLAPECADDCARDFLQWYGANHGEYRLFSGIADVLTMARNSGLELALVTGKGADTAKISIEALELAEYFPIVRTGDIHRDVKADHIRSICQELGVSLEHAAYVGDVPSDIRATREAGAFSVAALWGSTATAESIHSENPDAAFETVDDLRNWLERLTKPE